MQITEVLTDIADAIRTKEQSTGTIPLIDFADRILDLPINPASSAGASFTSVKKIDDNWKFNLITSSSTANEYDSDIAQAALSGNFETVSLPHDWSIHNSFNSTSKATYEGGYLDGGDAWYKKILHIDDDSVDNRYFLYFEGVYMESDIIVNGTHLNTHKHGYTNFFVEITDNITLNDDNTILVYVKNRQPSSRWYSGSGIYRDVYLIKSNKVGIKQQSVTVLTPDLETEFEKGYCTTNIDLDIENITSEASTVVVRNTIKYFGESIAVKEETVSAAANTTIHYATQIIISEPHLWDVYDGQYYTLYTEVVNKNGEVISSSETYYGYRYFKFNPNTGFYLNGKHVKLHGMCLHHDLGVLGAEINQSAVERQLRILKEAGVNAIRLTHNPSCSIYTNTCMKMGIMCIEEIFDCWTLTKKTYDYARFFLEYAESDIKAMVKRSRNNPSVIMWSLGNEIYDTRSTKSSTVLQDPIVTATNLRNWVRELDTTRPCTMGENGIYDSLAQSVANVMDVQGFNYGSGNNKGMHSKYPTWCIYGSETASAISSRGIYSEDATTTYIGYDQTNKQCSSYDNDKVSWGAYAYSSLNANDLDFMVGEFVWTGFDYIGEPTPFNKFPCRSSYFGMVDIAGIPKDIYYLYQSKWATNYMCHIVPMNWNNWTVGTNVRVMIYSNASYIKLFLNGTLVDTLNNKSFSDANSKGSFYADVPFAKGRLVANAYDENDALVAQDVVTTSYNASKILLQSDKIQINKNSDDLIFITASICDINNNICPNANNTVTFSATNASIIGVDNGNATSTDKYRIETKACFSGKCVGVIKPNRNGEDIVVTVTSNGLTSNTVIIAQDSTTVYSKNITEFIDATEDYVYNEETIDCTGVSLNQHNLSFNAIGDTSTLIANILPEDCKEEIIWNSDDNSIASVNGGTVTSIANGSCNITVTCGDYSDSCTVTVSVAEIECTGITLSETNVTLTSTSQYDLTATISPDECAQAITWESDNTDIAIVDNGGHMSAVATGSCNIIVACGTQTAICAVTVNLETDGDDSGDTGTWDVEWNGEATFPARMNMVDMALEENELGSYYITGTKLTSGLLTIDDSISKDSEMEVEIMTTVVSDGGVGWTIGVVLCDAINYRNMMFKSSAKSTNILCGGASKTSALPLIDPIEANVWYKVRIVFDSVTQKGNYYLDNNLIVESRTHTFEAATTLSNLWVTSPNWKIRAIRYKKN